MAPKVDSLAYLPRESFENEPLPLCVDLRPLMTPVEDQGQTSSCVANAVAGAYEYWIQRIADQRPKWR